VAGFVARLVAACPEVSILATSREGLGIVGERMIVVPSLTLPEATGLEGISEAEAVRLFVDRARDAKSTFALTSSNAAAVEQLCRRLDGIPLAIELAAARVRSMSPAELAERLDERFRLLGGGRLTAVERHQTLRRAIDWSFELLSESERVALRRCAVFAGAFSLGSAQAVVGGDDLDELDVLDVLGRLVDKSLVVAVERDEVTRYRLLETIRQYAQERLEAAGEADGLRRRHAEHYTVFAQAAGEGMRGPDEAAWTERVIAELDDLRAAVAWAAANGLVDLSLRVLASFQVHITRVGDLTLGWGIAVTAVADARTHPLYPQVLAFTGLAHSHAGDVGQAKRTIEEALSACDTLDVDEGARCRVLLCAAWVAANAGRYDEAGRWSERWLASARASGDDYLLAGALNYRASNLAATRGDLAEARAFAEEALSLSRRNGNPTGLGLASLTSCLVRITDDPDGALSFLTEGMEALDSVGHHAAVGSCLGCQAWVHYQRHDIPGAASLLAAAVSRVQRASVPMALGGWLGLAALVMEACGDDDTSAILRGTAPVVARRGVIPAATEELAATEDALRRRLGRERFDAAVARGTAMDADQALTFVGERFRLLEESTRQ
jgi:predicted ATPase